MTADIRAAGAASHAAEGWHTINWKSAYRIVCRLQARIVKAIQEGRWGKVKALQYLLTHSFSGKALAIRRVTENQGKGTPGVDREIWDTPEKKATALQALRQRGYNPQPLRRVYILEFCKLRRDCVKSRVRWIIPEDHPGRGRARVRTNHRHRMTIRNVDARPNRLFCGISRGIGTQSVVTTTL